MKILAALLFAWLYVLSWLPFWILHIFSDGIYLIVYRLWKYRVKVVRENLRNSFPEKSATELRAIEKKFYENLCDLVIETIKTFSISSEEVKKRCVGTSPELLLRLYHEQKNLTGICSHLGNWEWMSLSVCLGFHHKAYGIYKPLANEALDKMLISSRSRFGFELVPMKKLRAIFKQMGSEPIVIGLLSDQAPHFYDKAFQVNFLHQKTFVFPGSGLISVERDFTPVWGWMRRTGRSRFEWGVELVEPSAAVEQLARADTEQVQRMAKLHGLTEEQSARALAITIDFNRRLEARIRENPADWLWSHRRWKTR